MKSFLHIPRVGLTRQHYVRLGIPKKLIRQATVVDSDTGQNRIDLARLAELSGLPVIELANAFQKADFPRIDLTGVRDRLMKLGLSGKQRISWGKGLEHPDPKVKDEFICICRALVEKLAEEAGVPVWGLTVDHFKSISSANATTELAEIGRGMSGLYYYCNGSDRKGEDSIDYLLKKLGFGRFEDLSLEDQLEVLKALRKSSSLRWAKVPITTQRYLVGRLAEEAGVPVWGLTHYHFKGEVKCSVEVIELAEIGGNLSGLYHYYFKGASRGNEIISYLLEKLGYGQFEDLPLEDQLEVLKKRSYIQWLKVPIATQRYLVEQLAEQAGVSVWELTVDHFTNKTGSRATELAEIGRGMSGFYYSYRKSSYKGDFIEYLLLKLGYGRFEDLSLEEQLRILKKSPSIQWSKVPMATQRYLVERLAEEAGVLVWELAVSHFRGDPRKNMTPIEIKEIGGNLSGFEHYHRRAAREGIFIDYLLEKFGFGFPPFNGAGRLFASSRAKTPAQSLHIQLAITRKVVAEWQRQNPGKSIFDVSKKDLKIILNNPEYDGLRGIYAGNDSNHFSFSYIDLICLAFQYVPLDEITPNENSSSNYLQPNMFKWYARSGAENQKPARVNGYYSTKRRDEEIATLIRLLENRSATATGEEEASKWVGTQRAALLEISRRIEAGEELSAPLTYALGRQEGQTDSQPALAMENNLNGLNPSQKNGVRLILEESNPLVMVQGPAGSGKTHTVAKAVERLVQSGKKVAYLTPTHKAADVFMERIAGDSAFIDLPILRLGVEDTKFSETARRYWVRDFEARKNFKQLRKKNTGSLFVGTIAGGVHFLTDEGAARTREDLFTEHLGGGLRINRAPKEYDVVIIDEASMASKPEAYTALYLAKRGVLIGDHVQLEPFPIEKTVAKDLGLNEREEESVKRSLLEELMFAYYPYVLLETNYRAINPVMIVLASRIFYDERIKVNQQSQYFGMDKETRRQKYPVDSLKLIDTSSLPASQKGESRRNTSFCNELEAELAVNEARRLVAEGFALNQIGFITPYQAQVDLIKQKLGRAFPETSTEYLNRWVSTFDGFQGDENKCIIISFVRSNDRQPPETGFVGNYHRVNVGITRAEERMVIIGDWSTLKKTGEGEGIEEGELTDNLSRHTRHIFEELETQITDFEQERKAVITRL